MPETLKILIVEDTPEWIKFHKHLLESLLAGKSFKVDSEMSAYSGFNKLSNEKEPYDLIISDLEMEEIEGERYAGDWFVRQVLKRKDYNKSGVIIISASYDIQKIAQEHGVRYIPKHHLYNNPMILEYKLREIGLLG